MAALGAVWKALVALVQLLWYNIESAVETIRSQKALREAAESRTAELEVQRAREIEAEIEKDIREGSEVLSSPDPAAAARDFLRDSFDDN